MSRIVKLPHDTVPCREVPDTGASFTVNSGRDEYGNTMSTEYAFGPEDSTRVRVTHHILSEEDSAVLKRTRTEIPVENYLVTEMDDIFEQKTVKKIRKPPTLYPGFGHKVSVPNKYITSSPASDLAIGTRIGFRRGLDEAYGTIYRKNRTNKYIVCVDLPNSNFTAARDEIGGGFGAVVNPGDILRLLKPELEETWETVPKHVGVMILSHTPKGDLAPWLKHGAVGRIISRDDGNIRCSFSSLPSRPSTDYRNPAGRTYPNTWWLHAGNLAFCTIADNYQPIHRWGEEDDSAPSIILKAGEVVTYLGSRGIRVGADGVSGYVCKGTVLKILQVDGRNVVAAVAGSCSTLPVGAKLALPSDNLIPLTAKWIDVGKRVEVKEEVLFRKRSLKGLKGKVLLPTDQDGDVGIEFLTDLEAGSLDGAGKDGHCLYVSSNSVEISE